jgi:hypothetical protein
MELLRVSYTGGPWDGLSYVSDDDQVPNVIAAPGWRHYRATEREYDDGVLVAVVYRPAPELDV